jgi:hypothetical protein
MVRGSGVVDDALKHKIAANESAFREVNEAIRSGRWPGEPAARVPFRCECGTLGCNLMVEMSVAEYEEIRGDGRRFLVLPDHVVPETEEVLEDRGAYLVVEKRGEAGRLAEEMDPRR